MEKESELLTNEIVQELEKITENEEKEDDEWEKLTIHLQNLEKSLNQELKKLETKVMEMQEKIVPVQTIESSIPVIPKQEKSVDVPRSLLSKIWNG